MAEDVADDLIDSEEVFRSMTGFEEIAVEQCFRRRVRSLAEDETMLMRAIMFVVRKREGMADPDAFRSTMLDRLDDLTARFKKPADDDEPEDPSIVEQQARDYATFVVAVGVSFMPDQYRALTMVERQALLDAAHRRDG